ncbi:MAG: hypothetical protein ABJH25_10560 [Marinomonas sp.]
MNKNVKYYQAIHSNRVWGDSSYGKHGEYILSILSSIEKRDSAIDFGCGQSPLASKILEADDGIKLFDRYDPSIENISSIPQENYDILINTDVLEHIPEDELKTVLKTMSSVSDKAIIIIHLAKAKLILPNGENAHCTIKKPKEWRSLLFDFYHEVEFYQHESLVHAIFICGFSKKENEKIKYSINLIKKRDVFKRLKELVGIERKIKYLVKRFKYNRLFK